MGRRGHHGQRARGETEEPTAMSNDSNEPRLNPGSARPAPNADTAPATMRAITRDAYGSANLLQVRDVARPVAAAGEVLVRVQAAGLDRGAWHFMTGRPYLMRLAGFGVRRPKDPGLGTELAGVVEAVGAEVSGLSVGDAVYGAGRNTFAQYASARPGRLARRPAILSAEQAAAVPVSGVTALQAVRKHGHLEPGQSVLVIGASGGVGSFAVQIAKALGGRVTGVASGAKLDFVRSLGAHDVIDYTAGDLASGGRHYDLVLDIGGHRSLSTLRRLLTPRGTLVFVGGEGGGRVTGGLGRQFKALLLSPFVKQQLGSFWVAITNTADLDTLRTMIEDGAITPALDRICSLSDLPAAIGDLEAGIVRGKVVATLTARPGR
jgi:NADPH:quinone reductase-like Zn-dependent oxidoreductase